MAAQSLTHTQAAKSLGSVSKKKPVVKNVLFTPYIVKWPVVQKETQDSILQNLKATLEPLGLAKVQIKVKGKDKAAKRKAEKEARRKEESEEHKKIRCQLVVGLNAVTRALERDELRLVLTERSVKPAMLTKHLIQLSAVRQCPAVSLSQLIETVAPLLNLQSVLALGLKKVKEGDPEVYNSFVDYVVSVAPKIELPWLNAETARDRKEQTTEESAPPPGVEDKLRSKHKSTGDENSEKKCGQKAVQQDILKDSGLDFTRFYIYKKDKKKSIPSFGNQDFIPFSDSGKDEKKTKFQGDNVETKRTTVTNRKRKREQKSSNPAETHVQYIRANVQLIHSNTKKTKGKKK